ncbi:DUF885 domain-containing protein [Pseudomarimonas salicorniae]|uniref:DUF885 domain-containing protein n=1 Tax=Pseudomarimonas salicorniae TaxID=2933270 RepID=A0ABT0GHI1_9GAMM|nr:DUF885 domain-containing protein [Lysobacter sp. CAU 1642]MCK7594005.1 DUF885 domain-containing protein [Lysobacter sp. CAU 1642]
MPTAISRVCLMLIACPLLLAACAPPPDHRTAASSVAAAPSVARFFADFTDSWMKRQPEQATQSAYFDGEAQDALDGQLSPNTRGFREETVALAREGLAQLAGFDRAAMSAAERQSAELMDWQLEALVARERFADYSFPLNQFSGANVRLPSLLTVVHPLTEPGDAERYLARLEQFDQRMGEAVERSLEQGAAGILPPRFILDATIAQMERFVDGPAAENPLVATFSQRLGRVEGLDETARLELVARAEQLVTDEVYPAWRLAIETLRGQRDSATDDAGLWRFPEGEAAYANALHQFTTTRLSAQEIHDIGLREVARIEGEMDAILRGLGRERGSVAERVAQLRRDLGYSDDASGRAAIMADIETMIRDAERRADALFDIRPESEVIAQPYPEFQWASAAASYTAPPLDRSRPGIYQMPLRAERLTRFGLRTLVYHETVPGHHFQVALSVENESLPRFRQVRAFGGISAFSEGWALYAERLAVEEGWYEGDPEGLLGQLDAELFRARRLVVDTGLHALRWTRQQAIDYGIPSSEVDRYVVIPGQATSYKIGQLEILRLRDRAREALGERFDPKAFHNRVLLTGVVPISMLEAEVEALIAEAGQR